MKKKSSKFAKKVEKNTPRVVGWKTTDDDEIKRRQLRGQKEEFRIEPLEKDFLIFGSFSVHSENGSENIVEVRSLNELHNSCSCPDFQVNQLGTCKHIEATLYFLKKKYKKRLCNLSQKDRKRTEIFLHISLEKEQIKIQWPENYSPNIYSILDPFFSADSSLLSDPVSAMSTIKRLLAHDSEDIHQKIRISRHIDCWVERQQKICACEDAKENFLKDVASSKRTLDILKFPFYPYQEEGILHLAFNEKAILADDMGLGKTMQAIGACELVRRLKNIKRVLIISPASLKTEWKEQIEKFTDLTSLIIQGPRATRLKMYRQKHFSI